MDWHKAENSRAEDFYPRSGRKAKKYIGATSKTILYRQLQNKHVIKWLCKFAHLSAGFLPSRDAALDAIDKRRLASDLAFWNGDRTLKVEMVQPRTLAGESLLDQLGRQKRLAACQVPYTLLQRVMDGLASVEMLADAFALDHAKARDIVADYTTQITRCGSV